MTLELPPPLIVTGAAVGPSTVTDFPIVELTRAQGEGATAERRVERDRAAVGDEGQRLP